MARTADRPVPSGRVSPRAALVFGHRCSRRRRSSCSSLAVNPLAAGAVARRASSATSFVYTMWLKRRTPQNIVIGGAAGAVPPLVGWAAVDRARSTGTALYLFAIVFFWTPPHFWALSLLMKDEYAKVGVPMLPVVRGEDETRRQILLYTVLLYAVTQLPFCAGGVRRRSTSSRRWRSARSSSPAPCGCYRRADRRSRAAPLPLLARLPRAAVRRDGRRRAALTDGTTAPWTASSPARTSAPA